VLLGHGSEVVSVGDETQSSKHGTYAVHVAGKQGAHDAYSTLKTRSSAIAVMRRGTGRYIVSVEILPIAKCRKWGGFGWQCHHSMERIRLPIQL